MKKIIKITLLTIFVLIGISMLSNVKAATASIKASKNPANVGDKVTITVTINAASWSLSVSGNGISGNQYVGNTDDAKNAITTKTITLDTSSTGSKTIVLSGTVSDGDTDVTTKINTSVNVVVNEKSSTSTSTPPPTSSNNNSNTPKTPTKSSDASLKSVTVGGQNYKIGNTMTVNADTSSIEIKAVPNSSKAKVTGNGTKELVAGTNKFNIKVTAEDGTTKNYSVTVIREEYVDDNPNIVDPNQDNSTQELRLSTLIVKGVDLTPQFNSETFEYSVYLINNNEVEIDATSNIEGTKIEITGNKDLIEGENIATIKLIKDDQTVEYKLKINKSIVKDEEEQKVGLIGNITNWWNGSGSTIVVFIVILVLLGVASIFAVTSYKYSNSAKRYARNSREDYIENESFFDKEEK